VTDIFLYQGEANPNDVKLTDPTVSASTSISGAGALASAAATLSGVGLSVSTGTGILLAGAATVAGDGTVTDTGVTGEGALAAQAAQVAGVGLSVSTGTGALSAQAATLIGDGDSESTGTGALAAQAATVSAPGIAQWVAHSDDNYLLEDGSSKLLQEDGASFFLREEIAFTLDASQLSGAGESSSTGTGDLQAGDSSISGSEPALVSQPVGASGVRRRKRRAPCDLKYYSRKYPEWATTLPDDPEACEAARQAFEVYDDVQDRLRVDDEAFEEMLREVEDAARDVTYYLESRTIAQMLDEARMQVQAARDAELRVYLQIAQEDAEFGELMEIL